MILEHTKFSDKAINFFRSLELPENIPSDVSVIDPYSNSDAQACMERFFTKFFSDGKRRVFVLGINPGRFGSGVTGIPFTDPVMLEESCKIKNNLDKRKELSSQFIYTFINKWGGPRDFYDQFFLSAVSPFGFIRNGVNCNYYDSDSFFSMIKPFIIKTLRDQIDIGARLDNVIILGSGENTKAFKELNDEHNFFENVYSLEHPRYVFQYKRKELEKYLEKYKKVFLDALS